MVRKFLIWLVLFLFLVTPLSAATVEFSWENPLKADRIIGFRLYQSFTSGVYVTCCTQGINQAIADVPYGTNITTVEVPDGTWYWMMTSYDEYDREGGHSTETTLVINTVPPGPPINVQAHVIFIPNSLRYLELGLEQRGTHSSEPLEVLPTSKSLVVPPTDSLVR